MLLNFGRHGEIEEGLIAYDKDTNESGYTMIKKVVKQKVANKTNDTSSKQLDKVNEKDNADKMASDVPVQDNDLLRVRIRVVILLLLNWLLQRMLQWGKEMLMR